MIHLENKLFTNRWSAFLLLLLLSRVIKWLYLAHGNYYVVTSDVLPLSYGVAEQYSIAGILKRLFFHLEYTFLSYVERPFFTPLLYIIILKLGNFHYHALYFLVSFLLVY